MDGLRESSVAAVGVAWQPHRGPGSPSNTLKQTDTQKKKPCKDIVRVNNKKT